MTDSAQPQPMIYEVTATVRADLVAGWEEYLRDRHVAEVVATGCFASATLAGGEGRYRIQYLAPSREALARYHRDHAARLRADALARFPEGISIEREEWPVLRSFRPD